MIVESLPRQRVFMFELKSDSKSIVEHCMHSLLACEAISWEVSILQQVAFATKASALFWS
jgi:hypothetical protein